MIAEKRPHSQMKVLIIGDINIIFTYEFIIRVLKRIDGIQADVLNFAPLQEKNRARDEHLRGLGCRIDYQPAYHILKKSRLLYPIIRIAEAGRYLKARKYDVVNVHFPGVDSWIVPHIIRGGTRLVTSIYGSDLLRASKRTFRVLKSLFKKSTFITAASRYVEKEISERTEGEFDSKIRIAKYGSTACEEMHRTLSEISREKSKATFGIPAEKISVLCGYNASEAQRHLEIIDECKKLPDEYRERIHLVFHCSYGGNAEYIRRLQRRLREANMPYTLTEEYMRGERLAQFRKAADIFVNIQPTDVLSASMIEELEAGAICIAGSWLNYPDLDEYGAKMVRIKDLSSLHKQLSDILSHLDQFRSEAEKNRGVWSILSWEKDFEKWKDMICGGTDPA
ncbi:MAG: glycosyltransferase [Clostridia bacterium]|nr:glycosyltransferase [Clostridia bacterium]